VWGVEIPKGVFGPFGLISRFSCSIISGSLKNSEWPARPGQALRVAAESLLCN
jgi:hypothetical protein